LSNKWKVRKSAKGGSVPVFEGMTGLVCKVEKLEREKPKEKALFILPLSTRSYF
jgi:hypothetical protein